jgi:hypothetical protein
VGDLFDDRGKVRSLAAGRSVTAISRRDVLRAWKTGEMRRLLCALILISACSSPVAPSVAVAGTWAENFSVVGASLILTLDNSGNGTGTYAIEAGRSGSVQVAGRAATSMITLIVRYDYGPIRTFTGTLTDGTHLSGTVVFTRH